MTLPEETVGKKETICMDCEEPLKIDVLVSGAGYYIGFFCPNCGPYSRESGYYKLRADAEKALNNNSYWR